MRRPGNAPGGSDARLFYRQISLFTRLPALWLRGCESHAVRKAYETLRDTDPPRHEMEPTSGNAPDCSGYKSEVARFAYRQIGSPRGISTHMSFDAGS